MAIATLTHAITRVHTATHLSNAIAGAIAEILTHLGISARSIMSAWENEYDPAVRAWIEEGSLAQVVVQCHRTNGTIEPIFEFPIQYFTDGSATLSHRHVALARSWVKLNKVPSGTTCAIICQYRFTPKEMPGWTSAKRAATGHLRSVTLGTLASGPHASASIRMYTR